MDLRILLISVILLLSFFDFCVQDTGNGNNANNNSQNNNNNNYNGNTNNNCSNAKNDNSNNGNKNNNNNNNGNNNNGNRNNNNNGNNNSNQNNNNNSNGSNCSSSDNNDDGNNSNSTTTNDDDSDNSSDDTEFDTTIRTKENTASDDDTSVTKPTPDNNNTTASVSTKSAATSPFTTKPTATVSNLTSSSTEHTEELTSAKNVTKPTIHSATPPLSIDNTSVTNNVTEATTLSNLSPTTAEQTVGLTSANNVTEATTLSNLSPTTADHTAGLTSANNVTEATTLSNLSPTSTDRTVGPALVTNMTERDKQSMSRRTNTGPTDTGTEARTSQPSMVHEPGQGIRPSHFPDSSTVTSELAQSIGLNGVRIKYVGENECIHCVITLSDPKVTNVSWYRGNARIQETPNSRFTMGKNGTDFTLYIENVTRRDAGNYSCRLKVQGQQSFTPFLFQVYDHPEISIRPLNLTVSKGGSRVNFTCRITNEKDLDNPGDSASFVWMVNNATISANQSNQFVVSKISNVEEQMGFEPDPGNGFVTCSFIKSTTTAQYHVLKSEVKSCPEEKDQNGITWTSVLAGSTVLADCPANQSGEASRRCGYDGHWAESANLLDCVSLDLIQLEWKIDDKIDGVEEDGVTFGTLLEEMRNVTRAEMQRSKNCLLGAGNLDKTVDLLEKISDHQNKTTEEEIQVFADIVDSVLDLQEDEEWERITSRSRSKPAVILESVQRTGVSAGMQLPTNASLSINRTNIELYISKMAAVQTLVFPSGSNKNNSYFVLSENSLRAISDAQTRSPANADDMSVVMTATRYTTISSFMPATLENNNGNLAGNSPYFVNTEVLSLSFGDGQVPINLRDPIVLYFKHIYLNASDPICSFWNFDSKTPGGAWSGAGCNLSTSLSNLTHTVCRCYHLTNFAVLMSQYTPSPKDEAVLEVITIVGCSLSIIGCLLTIAVYIRLWRYVKSARYNLLLQLCSSLVIVYSVFLAGINKTDNHALCTAVALLLHFFLLVAFCLMLAMGIEIAINVTYVFATRSKLVYLILIGWAVPFVIVVIAASVTGLEGYGGRSCWLSVDNGLIYAFVGPAILVIIANSVILWIVLRAVYSTSIMITRNTLEKVKTGARSMCVLMPVMGITWVFGMLTVNEWLVFFQYIFAICNCLQGVFIFVMYCLLNSSVREGIQRVRYKHNASNSFSSEDSKQRKSAVSKKTLLGFGMSLGIHSPEGSNSVKKEPSQLNSSKENIIDPTMDINLTPLPFGLEENAVQE